MTNKLCISFDQTLGAGCREFESRHSDHKSRKSICSLGFYLLNAKLEKHKCNMPVAYCCNQFKNWLLPQSAHSADANESRHSDQKQNHPFWGMVLLLFALLTGKRSWDIITARILRKEPAVYRGCWFLFAIRRYVYDEKEVFSLHDANDHVKLPLRDPFGQPAADAVHQLRRRQGCPLPGCAVYRHHRHLRHRIGDGAHGDHLEHLRSSGDPGTDPDRRIGRDHHSLFRYDPAAQADGHWQSVAAAGCLQP